MAVVPVIDPSMFRWFVDEPLSNDPRCGIVDGGASVGGRVGGTVGVDALSDLVGGLRPFAFQQVERHPAGVGEIHIDGNLEELVRDQVNVGERPLWWASPRLRP